jgi:PilZ domain
MVPNKLAFIQLDQDGGGRVLNISEEGLAFEAFAPVQRNGPIRFWFSPDLTDRIEAVGELAWTNATGKIGGLKFLELSAGARGQIRSWTRQNSKHLAIVAENSGSEVSATPALSYATHLVPLERYRSATRRQLIRGLFLGVLLSSAVAIPAVKYSNSRKQVVVSRPALGQTATANSGPQTGATVPVSAPNASASRSPTASTAGKTKRSVPEGYSPDNPPGSSVVRHRQQSLDPSAEDSSTLSVVQPPLHETRGTKKIVASPRQLWSAVQGGNAQAALTLAGLYLRGDGVPVNCDQARVLLLMASEKRNAQAIKELRQLDKTGCPAPVQ